jgi:hypothetical protein
MAIGLPKPHLCLEPTLLNRWMRVAKAIQIASLNDRVLRPELLYKA